MGRILAFAGAIGLFLSAMLILWRAGLPTSPNFIIDGKEIAQIGGTAPSFQAKTLKGQNIALQDARGTSVILNFWATWCEPCVLEMPILDAVHQAGVNVVGINVGQEETDLVREWVSKLNLSFPIIVDDSKRTLEANYRIQAYPTTFFIDKQGIIRHIVHGALDEGSLHTGLESIGIEN